MPREVKRLENAKGLAKRFRAEWLSMHGMEKEGLHTQRSRLTP